MSGDLPCPVIDQAVYPIYFVCRYSQLYFFNDVLFWLLMGFCLARASPFEDQLFNLSFFDFWF